jgi:glutamyl-tRNA synthetase
MSTVRVRFAPSPTGFLHVGGARTALFNWLFARHSGGKFILRIEDTDRERSKPEYEEAILRDLRWLGLDWDEGPLSDGPYGPYFQTQRGDLYRAQMDKLLAGGNAYRCFCPPEELENERKAAQSAGKNYRYSGKCRKLSSEEVGSKLASSLPFAIRLKVPEGSTTFTDIIRGEVTVDHAEMDDLVLVRTGGEPTYNFVATVDDALMKISHVIRGEDHLSNTPKQILIYRALGFEPPLFAHIPLILGPDRTPLSKRHGASSVGEFKRQGYLPEAMMNYLALLGWSFDGKTEVFTQEALIQRFGLDRVVKSPAAFDYEKLQWLNGHYIREADDERIHQLCLDHLLENKIITKDFIAKEGAVLKQMILLVKSSLKTISDVADQLSYLLTEVTSYDQQAFTKHGVRENIPVLERAIAVLQEAEDLEAGSLEQKFRAAATADNRKFGEYVHPMRLALTGRTNSPNLFEILGILGKERSIGRFQGFIQAVQRG